MLCPGNMSSSDVQEKLVVTQESAHVSPEPPVEQYAETQVDVTRLNVHLLQQSCWVSVGFRWECAKTKVPMLCPGGNAQEKLVVMQESPHVSPEPDVEKCPETQVDVTRLNVHLLQQSCWVSVGMRQQPRCRCYVLAI